MSVCAPAVVAADSHLGFCDTDDSVVDLWVFVWVHGIFYFVWSVWKGGEHQSEDHMHEYSELCKDTHLCKFRKNGRSPDLCTSCWKSI